MRPGHQWVDRGRYDAGQAPWPPGRGVGESAMTERAHAMDGSTPVEWRTSETDPYAVDWVDLRGVPGLAGAAALDGRLGMSFAPGKFDPWGHQRRDLAVDVARLRDVHRVDALLLLVEDDEMSRMDITALPEALAAAGVALLRTPDPGLRRAAGPGRVQRDHR